MGDVEAAEEQFDHAGALRTRQEAVNRALNGGNTKQALQAALENPPLGCKDEKIKLDSLTLVTNTVSRVKDNEIQAHVDQLSSFEVDTLMKFIYKGLGEAQECGRYLKWHEVVTNKAGLGVIVRAIAERRGL
eukprot:CAMPEP_0177647956 /NCGR_PEP_ID=MMETSP0447-20121125/10572_1 /TAXON_ID=0 /ORGANISM="Stygamoeba regulata, Strain BSH-02190019" /LENGTH=131 /DNA_ID=CAMNT_0019150567 /DNA_START=78 /DNA_END=473 /DNA_ORIENTATION=+